MRQDGNSALNKLQRAIAVPYGGANPEFISPSVGNWRRKTPLPRPVCKGGGSPGTATGLLNKGEPVHGDGSPLYPKFRSEGTTSQNLRSLMLTSPHRIWHPLFRVSVSINVYLYFTKKSVEG